ncbi:hypothetical protein NE237_007908 [Protea cynaroides]|uniref:Uncharacterized protein n=1 Tax=Protea cynaroides TaxID=273540 RepID=A0A9Q0KQD9_9MAGN|nr:hypothetical protein NE237_007908 [Protea cynaroides]
MSPSLHAKRLHPEEKKSSLHYNFAKPVHLRLVTISTEFSFQHLNEKTDLIVGKNCRLRWFNESDPRINRRAFTEDRLSVPHGLSLRFKRISGGSLRLAGYIVSEFFREWIEYEVLIRLIGGYGEDDSSFSVPFFCDCGKS